MEVKAALAALGRQREQIAAQAKALAEEGLSQRVIGEEQARLMKTARHGHQVAYNAQSAVDAKHGLIAAFELTNEGNDLAQLQPMAQAAKTALQVESLKVAADSGYSNGEQAQACEAEGITPAAPRPETVNPKNPDLFTRDAFAYDKANDSFTCPAGQTLLPVTVSNTERKTCYAAPTAICAGCALKPQCTKAKRRTLARGFYEDAKQAMHQRTLDNPGLMTARRCLAEHPFGVIKGRMGYPRFLVRGLRKARAELALDVMAFNLTRAISILGTQGLLDRLAPA